MRLRQFIWLFTVGGIGGVLASHLAESLWGDGAVIGVVSSGVGGAAMLPVALWGIRRYKL